MMGTVVRNGALEIDEVQKVEDEKLGDPEVQVAARVLKGIMDGLIKGITFTTETRADFAEDWGVPTLDSTWRMIEAGGRKRRIGYMFFKKPVSSKLLTLVLNI